MVTHQEEDEESLHSPVVSHQEEDEESLDSPVVSHEEEDEESLDSAVVSHEEEDEESLDYPVIVEFVDEGNNSSDTEALYSPSNDDDEFNLFKRVRWLTK